MPWCVGVIGHDGSDPGMKAGLCAFQRVVSLPAPSWGANNTLPIACSHIYMKFKTIQWFDHFGLPDEARESLSAYLKAAPLCSKACLAPAAIGKVQCLCDKAPVAPPWLHIPGSGLGGREAASRCSGLTAQGQSLKFQQIICQQGFAFIVLAVAWDLQRQITLCFCWKSCCFSHLSLQHHPAMVSQSPTGPF